MRFKHFRVSRIVGVAAAATAAVASVVAGPMASSAHADTFVGTHTFQPRNSLGSLATKAVFPDPGPADVSVITGAGTGGQWNMFNQPDNGNPGVILKNRAAGLCLDTSNGGTSTSVRVRECDGTISQNWFIVSVPGTNFQYFTIQNQYTKAYLTTVAGSSVPNLQSFSSGNTRQHWVDTRVEG